MNGGLELLSDTFDNFSFSDSVNLLKTNFNPCSGLRAVTPEVQKPIEKTTNGTDSNQKPKENITFDDSVFFTDSFTSLTSNDLNQSSKVTTEIKESPIKTTSADNNGKMKENLTFDDSVFFTDSFTSLTSNNVNGSNKIHSEDLFSESEGSGNKNSKSKLHLEMELIQGDLNLPKIIDKCELSTWGLPDMILQKYKSRSIKSMFPWQCECLSNLNVLNDSKNLVYSAPTSAGKTLVAEILAIKTVMERKKKVLFILPFVSVVREKMFYFQDILNTSGVRVEGFMGSYNPPGGFQSVQVAICTIEKANSLINRLLEEGTLSDLGAVIVDEMHLLGDSSRGYLLELLLTKLRYMSLKDENVNVQIIGMSATLPNLDLLAKWLNAELYMTTFRPIPLYEQCYVNGEIYNNSLQLERKLPVLGDVETDTDNILQLCLETIQNSCSVLIFCPTKNWCENLAQQIASAFWKLGNSKSPLGTVLRQQLNTELISELLEQLKRCPVGLDKILGRAASFGVAFHHAGLTMDERDIIEGAFRSNVLRVLIATSTLSSGVNLPARRVIIRSPMFNGKPINTLTYKQMIGRAGRMGRDVAGESILICQKNDCKIVKELMSANLEPIESCLEGAGKLKRAILEVIASGVASTPDDVKLFTDCTLLAVNNKTDLLNNPIEQAMKFLVDNEFIRLQNLEDGSSKFVATSLAKACLSSSLPPEEGITLFTELEKARQYFVLDTELHLIYLVTPYSACNQWASIDWMFYLEMWERLPNNMKRVGELVGVRESYIIGTTRGNIQTNTNQGYHKLHVHKRFYTALALQELVNEVPLNDVAAKFNCSRGVLQSLQQSAATFAGMVTSFSKQLGWSSVEILISQFQGRLHFGVNRDLLDLMRLPLLNGPRARTLYNNGIENLVQLASADLCLIENILHKVVPFESGKGRDGETEYEAQQRNKVRTVWVTGKQGLTERQAAEMLIDDARRYLQLEIGLVEAKWENVEVVKQTSSQGETNKENSLQSEVIVVDELHTKMTNSNTDISADFNLSPFSVNSNSTPSKSNEEIHRNVTEINWSNESLFLDSLEENIKTPNTDSIALLEDAFVSSFNLDVSSKSASTSSDCIATSQNEGDSAIYLPFSSVLSSVRKRSRISEQRLKHADEQLIEGTPKKKQKLCKNKRKKTKIDTTFMITQDQSDSRAILYNLQENLSVNLTKLEIIDVCVKPEVFDCFCKEIQSQNEISLSLACTEFSKTKHVIGKHIVNTVTPRCNENNDYVYDARRVEGISVSWGQNTAYYISLRSLNVSKAQKLNLLKTLLKKATLKVKIFDCKEQIKALKLCCGIDFECVPEDPKVGDWLLDPEEKEKNLQAMALKYSPEVLSMTRLGGSCKGIGSIGLDLHTSVDPRIRSSVEVVTTWHLVQSVKDALAKQDMKLLHTFYIEMVSILTLTKMELVGIGVNVQSFQNLRETLNEQSAAIEKKAYQLAGRNFSFSSTTEVAKVLGLYKGKRVSTNKLVLERNTNPIALLILQWRKLNNTLTQMVYPLLSSVKNNRLHGCCIMRSATGRISMHEPNLQNVAKDYEILNPITNKTVPISCRSAFACSENYVLLSADYCQLELRLLAHLSKDSLLCTIMKTDEDIFRSVAAKINDLPESEITDKLRQQAKQICYGIIYGMGIKCLSEQMSTSEEEATKYLEQFHKKYPGIKQYIQAVIKQCKQDGYVETIAGRRRYLPHINHNHASTRSQAERQAVNTTIQGSAADIAKNATVLINSQFQNKFKTSKNMPRLVLQLHDELLYEVPIKYLKTAAKIVKNSMEESVKLSIPFPVKLKTGSSWGALKVASF